MTSLHSTQSTRAGAVTREPPQQPMDAARTQELYAAWKAIFENARPAAAEPARSRSEQRPGPDSGDPERERVKPRDPQIANGVDVESAPDIAASAGRTSIESPAVRAVSAAFSRDSDVAAPAARPSTTAADTPETPADVAVRVHYTRPVSAQSTQALESEVVSIILEGAQVSIVVRDAGLTETEALRTAFETARELTGRSASLQQLTLNGRVLYQQANAARATVRSDILFAC